MSTASERLTREADDIRALAGEHGDLAGTQSSYALVELVLRIVAKALLEPDEQEEQAAA